MFLFVTRINYNVIYILPPKKEYQHFHFLLTICTCEEGNGGIEAKKYIKANECTKTIFTFTPNLRTN